MVLFINISTGYFYPESCPDNSILPAHIKCSPHIQKMFLNIQSARLKRRWAASKHVIFKTDDDMTQAHSLLGLNDVWMGRVWAGWSENKLTRVILLPFGRNRLSAALALERYLHEFLDAGWAWDSVLGIEWFLLFLPFHIETIRRTDPARRKNNGFFQEWKSQFFICSFMHHLFRTGSFIIICFEYWQYWHLKALFVPGQFCHFKIICVIFWLFVFDQWPGPLGLGRGCQPISGLINNNYAGVHANVTNSHNRYHYITVSLHSGLLGPDASFGPFKYFLSRQR